MMELKCASGRLLGMTEGHFIEIACRSTKCGKRPGVVVIHKFDIRSGDCVSTRRYTEAHDTTQLKGDASDTSEQGISLRTA
jgi:hypothetical protein